MISFISTRCLEKVIKKIRLNRLQATYPVEMPYAIDETYVVPYGSAMPDMKWMNYQNQ